MDEEDEQEVDEAHESGEASEEEESKAEEEKDGDADAEKVEEDPEDKLRALADQEPESKEWKNRQRVLCITQRGIKETHQDFMDDLIMLIPHSKSEAKVERKHAKGEVDSLCYERSCNNFIYFEQRLHRHLADLYMWLSKSPNGPAFKFHIQNVTPLNEYKLSGNNLKYSRALVSFDAHFNDDKKPELQLAKEMLSHVFNTPKNHPKSKPFVDHVISFHWVDGAIYFRHYQILNQNEEQFTKEDDIDKLVLIEIGPRFSMTPIKAFAGSLGGETLW